MDRWSFSSCPQSQQFYPINTSFEKVKTCKFWRLKMPKKLWSAIRSLVYKTTYWGGHSLIHGLTYLPELRKRDVASTNLFIAMILVFACILYFTLPQIFGTQIDQITDSQIRPTLNANVIIIMVAQTDLDCSICVYVYVFESNLFKKNYDQIYWNQFDL